MLPNTTGDNKAYLDELTTRIDNVTWSFEGMIAGPQCHYGWPPTVSFLFRRVFNQNGEQEVPMPPSRDSYVARRSTTSQRRSCSAPPAVTIPVPVTAKNTSRGFAETST